MNISQKRKCAKTVTHHSQISTLPVNPQEVSRWKVPQKQFLIHP